MMIPSVVAEAGEFLEEERRAVAVHVANSSKSLIVFGDQMLVHWSTAKRRQINYLLVDPQDPVIVPTDDRFEHLNTVFEALNEAQLSVEVPRGFVFSFNLYSYLDKPAFALASMLRRGDIVCVSNWTDDAPARMAYLHALNAVTGQPAPHLDSDPLGDLLHLRSSLGHRTSVWRQVNRESTQFFLRCL